MEKNKKHTIEQEAANTKRSNQHDENASQVAHACASTAFKCRIFSTLNLETSFITSGCKLLFLALCQLFYLAF